VAGGDGQDPGQEGTYKKKEAPTPREGSRTLLACLSLTHSQPTLHAHPTVLRQAHK